jgi:hypothetical protein
MPKLEMEFLGIVEQCEQLHLYDDPQRVDLPPTHVLQMTDGEKDCGIAAAMIVAVNGSNLPFISSTFRACMLSLYNVIFYYHLTIPPEINAAPDPKLFGDCQPNITLHLKVWAFRAPPPHMSQVNHSSIHHPTVILLSLLPLCRTIKAMSPLPLV